MEQEGNMMPITFCQVCRYILANEDSELSNDPWLTHLITTYIPPPNSKEHVICLEQMMVSSIQESYEWLIYKKYHNGQSSLDLPNTNTAGYTIFSGATNFMDLARWKIRFMMFNILKNILFFLQKLSDSIISKMNALLPERMKEF